MSKNNTKKLLMILMICFFIKADAQQWMGRTTGNYSGTYGIYNNASSISDSKYKYYFNFWGRGVNFYNDYLTYNAPVKLNQWANNTPEFAQFQDINGKLQMDNDWLLENINGKDKQFSFTQDIWGPAFMFPVSKHWNMSINTRQRSGMQMLGLTEDIARMARNGITNGQNAKIDKGFSANIQSYQELSFTLGGILTRNDHHKLSGGATIKFIRGLGAAYLVGNQINIQGSGTNSAMINGDFQYAYTDDPSVISPFNDPYGLFSLRSKGAGGGFDLALAYEYKAEKGRYPSKFSCESNDKRSDYDIKLSLALNDIGGVRFNKQSTKYAYGSTFNSPLVVPSSILDGFSIAKQNGFDSIGQNVFAAIGASKSAGFNSSLPTSLNFQADFRLSRHLYTAVYLNQSLKSNKSTGLQSTSMLSIIPRYESRSFEFSMPITLSENYKNFYLGAYARIGPVFFGSDNLGGLLNVASSSQFTGADIYGGVSFGIGHCPSKWFNNNVDPVYIDTVKADTLKTEIIDTFEYSKRDTIIIRDTIRVSKKDTVYIDKKSKTIIKRDTVYIEKTIRPKEEINKTYELNKKEEELNKRKIELDAREKAILEKQKGGYSETQVLKDCKTQYTILENENYTLKENINNKTNEILQLRKELDEVKKLNDSYSLENKKCDENIIKNDSEIVKLQKEILASNKKVNSLKNEIEVLKKAQLIKNNGEVVKGTDAEKLARVNKQVDSLKVAILYLENNLEQCKKNAIANEAEILKKATLDKAKAETNAKVAKKQADSMAYILTQKNIELENCKKNSTQNNAEVVKNAEIAKVKAENDAKVFKKQADSLAYILTQKNIELENCKKNSTQNNAEQEKLKKCADENAMLKLEMQGMSNTIGKLNSKNYALSYKVDSLINELKNCCKNCSTGTNNDAELNKKCQESKTKLEAEIVLLKSTIVKRDKSLDSLKSVVANQNKKQVELDAKIVTLNKEISDLKSKNSTNNSEELVKQLEIKNAELTKLKSENSKLQTQIKTLSAEVEEYKKEYIFTLSQSQKCSMKLDSCMRGLYNTKPINPGTGEGNGDGKGGPNPNNSGSTQGGNTENDSDDVYSSNETTEKTVKLGAQIIKILLNTSGNSSNSGSSTQTSKKSGNSRPTEDNSNTNKGNTVKTNTNSGETGGSGETTNNNKDRNSSGSADNSSRRR